MNRSVIIQEEIIDPQMVDDYFLPDDEKNWDYGGLVTFTGLMRGKNEKGAIDHMMIEHYPAMTEKKIMAVANDAIKKTGLKKLLVVHRVGIIKPQEKIVLVAGLAQHRKSAFDGVRMVMDFLKTDAPFWKKEVMQNGDSHWVEENKSDRGERLTWQNQK